MNGILSPEEAMALLYTALDERGLMPSSPAISTWKHCEYKAIVDTVLALAFPDIVDTTVDDAKMSGPVTVQECEEFRERLLRFGGTVDDYLNSGALAVNASMSATDTMDPATMYHIRTTTMTIVYRKYTSHIELLKAKGAVA